jgi:hypothetical protein
VKRVCPECDFGEEIVGRGKRVERVEIAPVLTNCSISLSYGGFVVLGAGFTLSTLFFVKEKYI